LLTRMNDGNFGRPPADVFVAVTNTGLLLDALVRVAGKGLRE